MLKNVEVCKFIYLFIFINLYSFAHLADSSLTF